MAQLGSNKWWTRPAQSEIFKTPIFTGIFHGFFNDHTSFEGIFPLLRRRWAQLCVKLSPKVPSCSMLELGWTSMSPSESLSAQLKPMTIGANFGPRQRNLGILGAAGRGKLGPTGANFADSTQHAENLHFCRSFAALSNVALMEVRARPCSPHWPCLGPNFGASCAYKEPSCAC